MKTGFQSIDDFVFVADINLGRFPRGDGNSEEKGESVLWLYK